MINDLLPIKRSQEERHLVIKQEVISDKNIIANKCNEMYSNVGSDIASSLNTTDDDTNFIETLSQTAFFSNLVTLTLSLYIKS